ncbi:MAG TPA: LacI family DNA-binding transcriptional regulator [Arachnia sp.]|nr:LacI family DNA-binding transcriptional regulator [Arachnia sp.]HMT86988.1 LacI family DNA-binding transcriptional regulator [Arachnia sp.]
MSEGRNGAARPVGGPKKANIYDVAERAGVSHMTVSRVLNGHPNIRETTRERVLKAIEEMNYTRSSIARALATSKAMRIGVLVDGPLQYGPNSTVRSLEMAARARGYAVSSFAIGDDEGQHVNAGVMELVTQGIDALCVIAPRISSLRLLREQVTGLPMLVVKEEPDGELHTVAVDQRAGARAATRHLIELGHRNIVHLAGPLDWYDARARAEAWRDTMLAAGLNAPTPEVADWSSDSGYEFGRTYPFDGVTAVFASNDQMALGLIHALWERGIRVPTDISVVGFDDVPDAAHYGPPLTTVRQPFALLGESIIEELMAVMEDTGGGGRRLVQPALVVRASTAPPA